MLDNLKTLGKDIPHSVLDILDEDNWFSLENEDIERETPESIFIRKSLFDGISSETKELLNIVLNAPDEFHTLLYNSYNDISVHTIFNFLLKVGWKRKKIKRSIKELRTRYENYYPRCSRKHH